MDVLRFLCTFLLFIIFRSIIRINIRTGENKKQRFSILFFFQFAKEQRPRVRKPINNKKGLTFTLITNSTIAFFTYCTGMYMQ